MNSGYEPEVYSRRYCYDKPRSDELFRDDDKVLPYSECYELSSNAY